MGKKSTSQFCASGKTTKITVLAPAPSVFAPGRDLAAQSLPRRSNLLILALDSQLSQNHSRFELEKTLQTILLHPVPGHLPVDQIPPSPVQPGLQHFQGLGICNYSEQPVPVSKRCCYQGSPSLELHLVASNTQLASLPLHPLLPSAITLPARP